MVLPRRLMKLANGRFCEEHDPLQAMNFHGPGFIIPDAEAERIGLKAYLDETGWGPVASVNTPPEEKAVAQAKTEDKSVDPPGVASTPIVESKSETPAEETPVLEPGLHIDPALRRGGRGR